MTQNIMKLFLALTLRKIRKPTISVWLLLFSFMDLLAMSYSGIMKGKHLAVTTSVPYPVVLTEKRNSSGHLTAIDGTSLHILNWLASRYDFSYNLETYESSKNARGYEICLANAKCDLVMGAFAMTSFRFAMADFSPGVLYSSVALIIPMPETLNNVAAVVKPFQLWVWIGIICVIPCVLLALSCTQRCFQILRNIKAEGKQPRRKSLTMKQSSFEFTTFLFYVFGVLLNQGAYFPDKRLAIRMVATVWCLAAFVLVNSYNSVLISYVTSPNAEPLINSITELGNVSSIHVVVDAGQGIDIVLTHTSDGSIYKQLGDKLKSYPKSRCLTRQGCVDLVKSGNHAYVSSTVAAWDVMKTDFLNTGKCELTLAKEKESAPPSTWALPKHSPFLETITIGMNEILDYGLLEIWTKWYQADARKCRDKADKIMQVKPSSDGPPRLSLKNLTGAFAILLIGYLATIFVFVGEKIIFRAKSYIVV